MPSKRRPTKASLVERTRAGIWQVRKTVYFLVPTIERLERYAFHHHLSLWEIVNAATVEYLDRVAPIQTRPRSPAPPSVPAPRSRQRTPEPPPTNHPSQASPPSTPSPRSRRRSSTVPSPVHDSQSPPSSPPSTRKTSAPPKSRKT